MNLTTGMGSAPNAEAASSSRVPPNGHSQSVFVPPRISRPSWRDNRRVLVMGAGLVLLFLFLAFNGMSHHPRLGTPAPSRSISDGHANSSSSPDSLAPILDLPRTPQEDGLSSSIDADTIARTVRPRSKDTAQRTLASVPPFDTPAWQPPPFVGSQTAANPHSTPASPPSKAEQKSFEGTSLAFVAKSPTLDAAGKGPGNSERRIQLPSGTRLRARLESAVNSATSAPVLAAVEYNYEQNGTIVVPAGAVITGHLENADRSGYVQIRFDWMTMGDAPPIRIEALATDLNVGPLRGRVEGKHEGRSVLVRSAAGIGEVAATLVGRGSLNQPLSGEDLLRERLSNNIGQTGDEQLSSIAASQRVVVSLPAGKEIYVVLEQRSEPVPPIQSAPMPRGENLQELQQILQLQRELTASSLSRDQ